MHKEFTYDGSLLLLHIVLRCFYALFASKEYIAIT